MCIADQIQEVLVKLEVEPSRAAWVEFASWLDKQCVKTGFEDPTSFYQVCLARVVESMGQFYRATQEVPATMASTIEAAQNYREAPSEQSYEAFIDSATASYPFGPGDGSHHIKDSGFESCQPGCGCYSGAGCLVYEDTDSVALMIHVREDLFGLR